MGVSTKKHKAMFDYIMSCPTINRAYFHSQNADDNSVSFSPIYSDYTAKQYIDGSSERYYKFAVVMYKDLSDKAFSNENIENIQAVQDFMSWIDEQNEDKNFPDFGENCTVLKIENLQNMPNLAGVDERNKAKYMFQCKVTYLERKNLL